MPGTAIVTIMRVAGELVFSRQLAGRFAEAAELKRLVRDRVAPRRDLGHSEKRDAE